MKNVFSLTLGALAIATLGACSTSANMNNTTDPSRMPEAKQLQAYNWTQINVIGADGNNAPAFTSKQGGPVVLQFDSNSMMVGGLCNNMVAQYALNGDAMQVSSPGATMKACMDQDLMKYEHEVGQSLSSIKNWNVISTTATDAAPILVLTFADGSKWRLKGDETAATKYGVEPTLVFLEVEPEKVSCVSGAAGQQECLKVREITYNEQGIATQAGPWVLYYGDIKGFSFTPGTRHILRVNRYPLKNVPADSANFVDELDMVVQSELIRR